MAASIIFIRANAGMQIVIKQILIEHCIPVREGKAVLGGVLVKSQWFVRGSFIATLFLSLESFIKNNWLAAAVLFDQCLIRVSTKPEVRITGLILFSEAKMNELWWGDTKQFYFRFKPLLVDGTKFENRIRYYNKNPADL